MVSVDVSGQLPDDISEPFIQSLLTAALKEVGGQDGVQVSCSVVDDQTMRQLNYQHRGIDKTTDVLSFPFLEDEDEFIEQPESVDGPLIGEIIISTEQIKRQAEEHQQTLRYEFSLMLVHGMLHLLGYDHVTDEERKEMFGLQEKILSDQL